MTPDTSIYFEVTVTISGHYPQDGVDPDSIVATIEKEGQPPVTMFGPDQVFHPGYSGEVIPEFFASPDYGFGLPSKYVACQWSPIQGKSRCSAMNPGARVAASSMSSYTPSWSNMRLVSKLGLTSPANQ